MSKSRKLKLIAIGLAIFILFGIIFGRVVAENVQQVSNEQCQYPTRPLVNGRCDNTDPADPTTIKGEFTTPVKPKPTKKPAKAPVEAPKCQP